MTTPSTERKAGPLLGTGAQTTWPFTFKVFAATDIAVTIADSLGVETTLTYGVDYTVSLNANQETSPGGTVTYPISGSPLPPGSRLVIVGNLPYDQPLDLPAGGNFSPLALENQLDRTVMQIQQLAEKTGRALQVSITTDADVTLPPPAASQLIGWDSTGENLQNVPLTDIGTAIAYGTYRYDTFTGNGSTTTFALSEDPAALANLDVSISGVVQVPGTDYSLVNGNLVFASAPANGTTILARYGQALPSIPDSDQVSFVQAGAGAVTRTVQGKLREFVSVKDFGAVGDGVTDDTAAIAAAHATGKPVFYPYGTYKHVGYFPACEGGIIGEGWSTNSGAKKTSIVFYNCTDATKGAITPKLSSPRSQFFKIENIEILASSWDATTGCLGYGVDVGAPVRMDTVLVQGFKKSNIFVHHVWPVGGSFVSGPYESVFINVLSTSSGQHGYLVGSGGNVVTFINCQGKYNGAPSFGVNPSVAGNYDGFFADQTADGNDITLYTPENISVIGGDCSYNSRYGWNFEDIANSASISPGYAEYNLVKEARCGNTLFCLISFNSLLNNVSGFLNEQTYTPYFYTNSYFIGGKQVHPANVYSFIENPTARDDNGGTIQNAPVRSFYLSRNNAATLLTQIAANTTPDGTAVNLNTETVATIGGNDTYKIGIGSGSRHLKIADNFIRLPDNYYQAVAPGWTANSVLRGMASAAPLTGTYVVGDIVYNTAPASGGYIGWVCTVAGTPGTWKGFGLIA